MGSAIGILLAALALALAQAPAPPSHFELGRALFEEHDDTGEALRLASLEFRRALAQDPRMAAAVAYLGLIAAEEGHSAEAESAYRKALEMDPKCAEARVGLAGLHLRATRNREAIGELRRAVADRPEHRMARRELASALTQENSKPTPEMWREAIENWQTLTGLDGNDRDSHHSLAKAYEQMGRWAEAERHYREVLRIGQTADDSDVWVYSVHTNVAGMCEKQGKWGEALKEYQALIDSEGAGAEEVHYARVRIERLKLLLPKTSR